MIIHVCNVLMNIFFFEGIDKLLVVCHTPELVVTSCSYDLMCTEHSFHDYLCCIIISTILANGLNNIFRKSLN